MWLFLWFVFIVALTAAYLDNCLCDYFDKGSYQLIALIATHTTVLLTAYMVVFC